jgi:CRISPR-associated protein (TIGR03984 family)
LNDFTDALLLKISSEKFETIKSKITSYDYVSIERLISDVKSYMYAVIWRPDGVTLDYAEKITEGMLANFTELRAFNESGELHVVSYGGEYRGRRRSDGNGADTDILDQVHLLWGEPEEDDLIYGGYTHLTEARGTELTIPFTVDNGKHAFIRVRNYLSSDEKPFEFVDWRFAEFIANGAKEYGEE